MARISCLGVDDSQKNPALHLHQQERDIFFILGYLHGGREQNRQTLFHIELYEVSDRKKQLQYKGSRRDGAD
ncbi:hypothetical protein [Natronogracilivirga saccharolytica]|uniref:Uncharacterized protein n=1 Tax=Natronogracilivirga saccharolytica TaxID=2812953 RepID=A0A8J7S9R3_9BACT|nr:hypothetical protein [Natronogracilivirga saccharolytica]MBP3192998.1 hypothetical protein [Natronogracilivirga saccharolytica]